MLASATPPLVVDVSEGEGGGDGVAAGATAASAAAAGTLRIPLPQLSAAVRAGLLDGGRSRAVVCVCDTGASAAQVGRTCCGATHPPLAPHASDVAYHAFLRRLRCVCAASSASQTWRHSAMGHLRSGDAETRRPAARACMLFMLASSTRLCAPRWVRASYDKPPDGYVVLLAVWHSCKALPRCASVRPHAPPSARTAAARAPPLCAPRRRRRCGPLRRASAFAPKRAPAAARAATAALVCTARHAASTPRLPWARNADRVATRFLGSCAG